MAYIAQRQDGGRDSRGRSTFANAGQTMMSPRIDFDQTSNVNGGNVYSSSYPYPGANSKVEMQYPGAPNETMMNNDAVGIGTIAQTKGQRSAIPFMNITPRTRGERSLIKDNDAIVRKKLEEEHSRHYRSPALIENHNFGRAFTVEKNAPMRGNVDDQYRANAHEMLKQQNDAKIAARQQFLNSKRMQVMSEEQRRWQKDNNMADQSDQRWDEIRASSLKAKSNLNSLPYDPISLQTKESADGLQYEYEEGLMTYRAALRSKNLYGRYNANGYNPINGTELWDVQMPNRPMQPNEVLKAQAAMQKLDAVKLVKQKCLEIGGSSGIRSISRIFDTLCNQTDGTLDKHQLVQGLQQFGITEISEIQIQNVMEAFGNNGVIGLYDFISALRGPVNERRKALIGMAWQQIDLGNSGSVSAQVMLQKYDVTSRREVVEGRMTADDAIRAFMQTWDKTGDSNITWDEFFEYYADMGAAVTDDDEFELMIRNAWKLQGGTGKFASTSRIRVMVLHKSGDWTIEEVPGGLISNTLTGSALMAEIKRRFREDGKLFLDIKFKN
eukprot:g9119.t1